MFKFCPSDIRRSGVLDEYDANNANLLDRWNEVGERFNQRAMHGIDPYQKVSRHRTGPDILGTYRNGDNFSGVNFASQDYLSLSSHIYVVAAAKSAADDFGVHSAGSAALMGNTSLSIELEQRLGEFLGYASVTVFPIGWAAGYGAVKTLVRKSDHVIIDLLAHACLQEAARDATANVHPVPHLSVNAIERRLVRIRKEHPESGILVITETLFSMDSDTPDLRTIQDLCRAHGATLFVDCAHDLGALGETGRGVLEEQSMVGGVDVLMGSFSKTFASNGGFVACNNTALKFGLRANCGPSTFTNAMSPIQAAAVLAALSIISGNEGATRRRRLLRNIERLRAGLESIGFTPLGRPSPIVPIILGSMEYARLMTHHAMADGGIVNLVEYPAVSTNTARWRLQIMAGHDDDHIDRMVEVAAASRELANAHLAHMYQIENQRSVHPLEGSGVGGINVAPSGEL